MNCVCGETLLKPNASMLHCDSCDDWYTKGTCHNKSALGVQWSQVSQRNLQRVLLEAISIYETSKYQLSYVLLFGQWWCVAPYWHLQFLNVFSCLFASSLYWRCLLKSHQLHVVQLAPCFKSIGGPTSINCKSFLVAGTILHAQAYHHFIQEPRSSISVPIAVHCQVEYWLAMTMHT